MTVRVLLVDDSLETLDSLQMMYSTDNAFEIVKSVDCTESALMVLQNEQIDLVSIDIQLGKENGFDLCQQIRNVSNNIFIVMCSLNADDESTRIANERGANLFVPKPMSLSDLRMILAAFRQFQLKSMDIDTVLKQLRSL